MRRIELRPEQLDAMLGIVPVPPAREPCPKCGTGEHLRTERIEHGYLTYCDACYDVDCTGDPPEFRATSPQGWGTTRAASCEAWNDAVC